MPKFALILALFAGVPTSAQTLWQDTSYGMSVEAVRAAVPGAVKPQNPGRLKDGAEELLRLESIELVNKNFQGEFFFKDAKLVQVTFSLQEEQDPIAGMLIFESLTEALRAKYGLELSREVKGGTVASTAEATWLWGRTNVGIFFAALGDDLVILKLNYQVRLAREADKL